jgi:hypothetical protein
VRRRSPAGLLVEIDVGERVAVGVADDEAGLAELGVRVIDGPGRRKRRSVMVVACGSELVRGHLAAFCDLPGASLVQKRHTSKMMGGNSLLPANFASPPST